MSCCSACAQGHACSGSRDNPRKPASVAAAECVYELGRNGRTWTVDRLTYVAGKFAGRDGDLNTYLSRSDALKAARRHARADLAGGVCAVATIQGGDEKTIEVVSAARHNPDKKPSAASKVPKSQIDFIVGNIHVGTPDEEVADNIRRRCEKNGFPAAVMKACVVYALKAHKRNRDLYNDVMMGRTSRRRSSR